MFEELDEDRRETRYLLRIPMLYSPAIHNSEDEGDFLRATSVDISLSGISFDVNQHLPAGEFVDISFLNHGNNESFSGEVRWCKKISDNQYRMGVSVISTKNQGDAGEIVPAPEKDSPEEIKFKCPSCKKETTFRYIGKEPVLGGKAVIPIYNCAECGLSGFLET